MVPYTSFYRIMENVAINKSKVLGQYIDLYLLFVVSQEFCEKRKQNMWAIEMKQLRKVMGKTLGVSKFRGMIK